VISKGSVLQVRDPRAYKMHSSSEKSRPGGLAKLHDVAFPTAASRAGASILGDAEHPGEPFGQQGSRSTIRLAASDVLAAERA
jgi:hypothetical protein